MTEITINELEQLSLKTLTNAGLGKSDSITVVNHYLENELSGKTSHGIVRIVQFVKVIKKYDLPKSPFEITKDDANIALINGKGNMAPVVGLELTKQAITRAKKHGIAFVGMHNTIINSGSMAYYLNRLTDENIVGLMSCNSQALVAPPSGRKKLLGTNPIGIGFPSADGNHFIADFATSAIAMGKILVAKDKGEEIPAGCLIDKDGNPSTNPKDALGEGAILPLADYRGFALGLFVELMAAMIGGTACKEEWFGKDGMFIIAIDPAQVSGQDYATQVEQILNLIRDSAPAPNATSVSIPGDRSAQRLKESKLAGVINVTDKTLENLRELAL